MRENSRLLVAAVAVTLVVGCGTKTEEPGIESDTAQLPTAETLGDQLVQTAEEYLAAAPYSNANQSRGEKQAQICRACHSFDHGGPNMIGPGLSGFFGTQVGSRDGYVYSAAMQEADFIWTPEALNAWLAQPGLFLPGNRMTFAGVLKQGDRDDLIAYLLSATANQAN